MSNKSLGMQVHLLAESIRNPAPLEEQVTPETLVYVKVDSGLVAVPLKDLIAVQTPAATAVDPQMPVMMETMAAMQKQIELLTGQVKQLQEHDVAVEDILTRIEDESYNEAAVSTDFHPDESVALGLDALQNGAVDRENVAVGLAAGAELEGAGNTLIGPYAGAYNTGELTDVTAIGYQAMAGGDRDYRNVTAIGARAMATGDNQVTLGDSQTNIQVLGAIHRRADLLDMRDAVKCSVGLDMVLNINPLQYLEDFRDSYIDWTSRPTEPEELRPEPSKPTADIGHPDYQPQLIAYQSDLARWKVEARNHALATDRFQHELAAWLKDNSYARIRRDGSYQGKRLHLGFNGRQLLKYCQKIGLDLALVQAHEHSGGESATSVSEMEITPILWTAIQDLYRIVHSTEFIDALASRIIDRQQNSSV